MQMSLPFQIASYVVPGVGKRRLAVTFVMTALLGGTVEQPIKAVRSAAPVSSLTRKGAKIACAVQQGPGQKRWLPTHVKNVLPP